MSINEEAVEAGAAALVMEQTGGLCDEWPRPCADHSGRRCCTPSLPLSRRRDRAHPRRINQCHKEHKMYLTAKPFTAARYTAEMNRTQMVDWLTVCGVQASRDSDDVPPNGEGPLRVQTGDGMRRVLFGWWVIPVNGIAVVMPHGMFERLFVAVAEDVDD